MKFKTEKTHISNIRIGDTIIHNGKIKTINKNNLKYTEFMGISLFGDSYNIGTIPVIRLKLGV